MHTTYAWLISRLQSVFDWETISLEANCSRLSFEVDFIFPLNGICGAVFPFDSSPKWLHQRLAHRNFLSIILWFYWRLHRPITGFTLRCRLWTHQWYDGRWRTLRAIFQMAFVFNEIKIFLDLFDRVECEQQTVNRVPVGDSLTYRFAIFYG